MYRLHQQLKIFSVDPTRPAWGSVSFGPSGCSLRQSDGSFCLISYRGCFSERELQDFLRWTFRSSSTSMWLRKAVHRVAVSLLQMGFCWRQIEGWLHEDARWVQPFPILHNFKLTDLPVDDRFIVKQLSSWEVDVLSSFLPAYFSYLADCLFKGVSHHDFSTIWSKTLILAGLYSNLLFSQRSLGFTESVSERSTRISISSWWRWVFLAQLL